MQFKRDIQKVGTSKDTNVTISQKGIEISHKGKPISGMIPELIELDFRCGVHRKGFRIIIGGQQNIPEHHYKVAQVLKIEKLPQIKIVPKHNGKKLDINVEEIEGISTFQCPHCGGGKSAVIKCGCGGLSCGGGTRKEGNKEYHECPWCGSVGVIKGHIENLSGERSSLHETLKVTNISKHAPKITDYSAKMLPPGNRGIIKR